MTFSELKTTIEANTSPASEELRNWLLDTVTESVYLEAELEELRRKVSDMENEISRF